MSSKLQKHLFSVDDYHKMADAGVFKEDDRIELINGEIIDMPPINPLHAGNVNKLSNLIKDRLGNKVIVSVQNPIHLNNNSEPQPDIALLKPRNDYYINSHPTPVETLLIIEVADSSLDYDRDEKIPLYANSNILEVWIRNLKDNLLEVYRNPQSDRYQDVIYFHRGQSITPINLPNLTLTVDEILG